MDGGVSNVTTGVTIRGQGNVICSTIAIDFAVDGLGLLGRSAQVRLRFCQLHLHRGKKSVVSINMRAIDASNVAEELLIILIRYI